MTRRRATAFSPVVFYDPLRLVDSRAVAVEQSADGFVRCVEWSVPYMRVDSKVIELGQLDGRYRVVQAEQDQVAGTLAYLLGRAFRSGATPEAIRLIGLLRPLTKDEEDAMAEKLKGKATADKAGLVKAAKGAPVAASGAKPRKGAAAALGDRATARKLVRITVVNATHSARAGTFRANMLADLFKSKTIGDFYAKNTKYDSGCISFAVKAGYVALVE